jgi:hypothetical protein
VGSLKMSLFDFIGPIELFKFVINLIGSIDFEISIILLCILMFLIVTFLKSFKNVTLVRFFELFG